MRRTARTACLYRPGPRFLYGKKETAGKGETQLRSNDLLKKTVTLLLGVFLFFTALYAYRGKYAFVYELTFLSNALTGVFLILTGILLCRGRNVPQYCFLDFAVLLLMVFGVTVVFSGNFNMTGSMFVLHVVNPLLFLLYYLLFSDLTAVKKEFVLTTLGMPAAYLLFSLLYGKITGNHIYFFLDYEKNGVGYMLLFVLGILVGTVLISGLLYALNRLLRKRFRCP